MPPQMQTHHLEFGFHLKSTEKRTIKQKCPIFGNFGYAITQKLVQIHNIYGLFFYTSFTLELKKILASLLKNNLE